jgi:hypothetical protein
MLAALILSAAARISRGAGNAAVSWANWQREDSSQFSVFSKTWACSPCVNQSARRSLHPMVWRVIQNFWTSDLAASGETSEGGFRQTELPPTSAWDQIDGKLGHIETHSDIHVDCTVKFCFTAVPGARWIVRPTRPSCFAISVQDSPSTRSPWPQGWEYGRRAGNASTEAGWRVLSAIA